MSFRIVLKGSEPSGRFLAVLCARTGETIDSIKKRLSSPSGMVLKENLSRDSAELFVSELPGDGSVAVSIQRDIDSWVAVLVGYRPGSRGRLRSALQRLSRLSTEEVIHFLASIPIALKSGVDRKTAMSVKELLEREGGIVEVRPSTGSQMEHGSVPSPRPVEQVAGKVDEPVAESAVSTDSPGKVPEIPPEVTELKSAAALPDTPIPGRIFFESPDQRSVSAPDKVLSPEEDPALFAPPYHIRFTVPGRPLPPALEEKPAQFSLPGVSDEAQAIPLYLHRLGPGQRNRAGKILEKFFDVSSEKSLSMVHSAPGVLCLFRERINALVALRELSEQGMPVSMVSSPEGTDSGFRRTSFFGWLNGTM